MKNYSEMSDAEIAQKVFFWVNGELCPKGGIAGFFNGALLYTSSGGVRKQFDPCNNPSDAWQTIYDNKITLIACLDGWIACPYGSVIDGDTTESQSIMYVNSWNKATCFADSNPLRAAMIVFLMMQDAKNG